MQVTHIAADRREEWNAFVAQEPSFALLQSWEWGEFKEKLGWKTYRIAVKKQGRIVAGAQLIIKPMLQRLASIAYIPRGPIGDWLNEPVGSLLLSELCRAARYHNAVFLRIEPPLLNSLEVRSVLQQHHFRASRHTNQPRATIILDLTPDLDDILKQMRKKTRQYIRNSRRKGVTIRIGGSEDLPAFCDLMRLTGQRCHFSPRTRDYYEYQWRTLAHRGRAVLLKAFYQDQLLAMRMVFCFNKHAAEFHAGSSNEYRHLRPDYLLVWEAIGWAKAQGCCTYDLWGIPDEVGQALYEGKDPLAPVNLNGLWGVYQFKRGFSKNVMFYASAHDYVFFPLLYAMITNRFVNGNMLDRFAVWSDSLRHTYASWIAPDREQI